MVITNCFIVEAIFLAPYINQESITRGTLLVVRNKKGGIESGYELVTDRKKNEKNNEDGNKEKRVMKSVPPLTTLVESPE